MAHVSRRRDHIARESCHHHRPPYHHHQERTPIEICPSSNLKTLRLGCLADHPTLGRWLETSHPISINTDGALLLWWRLLFWRTE